MQPKITVVVPTRERYDTLQYTLKTCITQDYENLIILVSDNYSQDKTKEVVTACSDQRIQYVNTGRRMSMSENWEFALSHINDGYVLYLGDDDALLPGSIKSLAHLINQTNCEAICWDQATYTWPYGRKPGTNILFIPLGNLLSSYQTDKMLNQVIEFKTHYSKLPWIYKGLVSFEAIQKAKNTSGRFFNSMTPDIYSGIVIATVIKEYLFSESPYTINGASYHSTGTTSFSNTFNNTNSTDLFFSEDNIPFHNNLVLAPSIPNLVAESFLQVKDHIKGNGNLPEVSYEKLLLAMMKEAVDAPPRNYSQIVTAVLEIGERNRLAEFARNTVSQYKNAPLVNQQFNKGYNLIKNNLTIDCESFGVRDIFEAARLCFYTLKIKKEYFSFRASLRKTFKSGLNKIIKNVKKSYYINKRS